MFYKLESLRGIAACLVILFHSPYSFFSQNLAFVSNSYLFVDLFFMLSGFVLHHAYAQKIQHGMPAKDFMLLRLARIYPIHLFMFLVFVAFTLFKLWVAQHVLGLPTETDRNNWQSAVSHLLLLHTFGLQHYLTWNEPSWSIAAEFYTYLTFFIYLKWFDPPAQRMWRPLMIAAVTYAGLFTLVSHQLNISYDFGFFRCVAGFYVGVFLYRMRDRLLAKLPAIHYSEGLSVLLVIVTVSSAGNGVLFQCLTLLALACLLLTLSSHEQGWIGHLLLTPPFRCIGKWSFSIYMTHMFVIFFVASLLTKILHVPLGSCHGWRGVLLNLLLIGTTSLISRYTYLHIEDKYRAMFSKYIRKQPQT